MVAFQKPITVQGSVTANSTTSTRSTTPKPPADSAYGRAARSARRSRAPTSAKNSTRRSASGGLARRSRAPLAEGSFDHGRRVSFRWRQRI